MQTFKRILTVSAAFLLILAVITSVILIPWKTSESDFFMDTGLRKSLAGEIDTVVIGASHGLAAFVPEIMDEQLSCFSYNLSGSMMTMYGKAYMLNKELERNPIKTVMVEMSFDSLSRQQDSEHVSGDAVTLAKLDSWKERFFYLFKFIKFDDWLNVYCKDIFHAFKYWRAFLTRDKSSKVDYSAKGFHPTQAADCSLPESEIAGSLNTVNIVESFREDNIAQFYDLLNLCKKYGCRTIVVTTPLSDAEIWKTKDLDCAKDKIAEICDEMNISFYDFNLLKDRQKLLDDTYSFHDGYHLSEKGAADFSYAFCECMKKLEDGENISNLFYSDYEEAKEHSPYLILSSDKNI